MNKILSVSAICLLTGCAGRTNDNSPNSVASRSEFYKNSMNTFTYDGCEYIYSVGTDSLTHKGNCKNCEKRLREILVEINR